MTVEDAIDVLGECTRSRNLNRAVTWARDGRIIARGEYKKGEKKVTFAGSDITFEGAEAEAIWTAAKPEPRRYDPTPILDRAKGRLTPAEAARELGFPAPLELL